MTQMHVAFVLSMVAVARAHGSVQGGIPPVHVDRETGRAAAPRTLPIMPAPAKDPFKNIFEVPPLQDGSVQSGVRPEVRQPRVVCGMTLLPANPEVDPKVARPRAPEPNREYKIRTISPRICRE